MDGQTSLIPMERIERAILSIRGEKVMLDSDLAELYGVETKALNQAVKRNANRFPEDFMFQLSAGEVFKLNRSQIVTDSQKHRDPRFPPYAFTEHGALMLANVLNSERAALRRERRFSKSPSRRISRTVRRPSPPSSHAAWPQR
jgi:hypothetical protein